MRYIFAGGGTGGHIFPAISIADCIRRIDSDAKILFIGSKGRLEEKLVPQNNYEIKIIELHGLNKGKVISNLNLPFMIIRAVREVKKIVKEFNPDAVVGTGGYAAAPLIYVAEKAGIPVFMQEGNAIPGKVTKMFAKKAARIFVNFNDAKKYFRYKDNLTVEAHPIRFSKGKIRRTEALGFFKLEEHPVLFVFGGSQGASAINSAVLKIADKLSELNINIIWQTGKKDFNKIKESTSKHENRIKVFEFINEMNIAYSAADLCVCRAGISSIMELAALSMPSLLIPYRFAAENHQEKNALALSSADACIVLKENELDDKLFSTIAGYIADSRKLETLGRNINKFSDPDSALKIANEIFNSIKNGN